MEELRNNVNVSKQIVGKSVGLKLPTDTIDSIKHQYKLYQIDIQATIKLKEI